MEKIMLSQILEKICVEDAASISEIPIQKLSHRHIRKMKRIFSTYQRRLYVHKDYPVAVLKRATIIAAVLFFATVTVTAGAGAMFGFKRNEQRGYTELLTVNAENSPKVIENVYYLPMIPEGYIFYEDDSNEYSVYKSYKNPDINGIMTFSQYLKEGYKENFDNEHCSLEELEINGHYALYLDCSDREHVYGIIVWDNGDYILEVSGNFTKDSLADLAKSAKF